MQLYTISIESILWIDAPKEMSLDRKYIMKKYIALYTTVLKAVKIICIIVFSLFKELLIVPIP